MSEVNYDADLFIPAKSATYFMLGTLLRSRMSGQGMKRRLFTYRVMVVRFITSQLLKLNINRVREWCKSTFRNHSWLLDSFKGSLQSLP